MFPIIYKVLELSPEQTLGSAPVKYILITSNYIYTIATEFMFMGINMFIF